MDDEAQQVDEPSFEPTDLEDVIAEFEEVEEGPAEAAPEPEPEPEPEPAPEPAPKQPSEVEQLHALMAEERRLQEERRKLDDERAKLEPLRKYETIEQRLKDEDAEGALEAMGVKLDELNRAVVEGRGTTQATKVAKELQARVQEMERSLQARLAAVEQAEIQRMQYEARNEIVNHIVEDKFPLTASVGDFGVQTILAKAQEHFKRDGQVPQYDQVIGEVEKELGSFVDQIMKSEAVRQRYLSQQSTSEKRLPSPTLTNGAASTVSKRKPRQPETPLPEDREEAIEAILAELG